MPVGNRVCWKCVMGWGDFLRRFLSGNVEYYFSCELKYALELSYFPRTQAADSSFQWLGVCMCVTSDRLAGFLAN